MYNVLIGICTGGSIHAETVTSLIGALQTLGDKGVGAAVSVQTGGYKPHNMNRLVTEAKANNMTHLMSIDCDMIFPSSGILRLLDHDKEIVGGAYNQRGNPQSGDQKISTVKLADEKGNLITASQIPPQLFKCWSLGLGFVLMNMSIFDKLEKPYFRDFEDDKGEFHTEDFEFFSKCQKAGIDVWCNPSIQIGHIGSYVY